MKTIFGNRKTLVSISAIMLALVLMVGGTLAWLVIGDDTGKVVQFGTLDITSDVFDYSMDADRVIAIEPGKTVTKTGKIENTGTLDAWIEIQRPTIYLTHDEHNKIITPYAITPGSVNYDQYTAGYQVVAANDSVYNYVYYSIASIASYSAIYQPFEDSLVNTAAAIPPPILYFKTISTPTRYFLVMPASGEYYKAKNDGTTTSPAWTQLKDTEQLDFAVTVSSILDLYKAGKEGGNEWNGAYMESAGLKVTQNIEEAVADTFGLAQPIYADLTWADDNMFPPSYPPLVALRGAANVMTPYEALQKYYGWD